MTFNAVPVNPNPWPDVVRRRRRDLQGSGKTFDYAQCQRALCRRWFPDERFEREALAAWCPHCRIRLSRAVRRAQPRHRRLVDGANRQAAWTKAA